MRRRRPPRRKIRFNGKIKNGFLKTFFVQTVLCMIIILAVIIYINIEKNGIDAIRSNFTNEENSLAGLTTQIKTLFDKKEDNPNNKDNRPDISKIIEETNNGSYISVMKTEENPFSEAVIPVFGKITSAFGYRDDPFSDGADFHSGVDIAVPEGSEVKAVLSGTILESNYSDIGGNFIKIEHDNGFISYYGHLSEKKVSTGDTVNAGDIIALSGNTGKTTGPHLHFQLEYNQRNIDPCVYMLLDNAES